MADLERAITRRRALQWAGGVGLAAVASACSGNGESAGSAETATTTAQAATETTAAPPDCVLMPELTEGPTTSTSTSCGATSRKIAPASRSTCG